MPDSCPDTAEDRHLLAAARAGDEASFRSLAERHRLGLETYCLLMLGRPDAARRLVDVTFALAWSGIDHAERRPNARIWLYWVATQVCLGEIERGDELRRAPTSNGRWS
jgi:DNA-directed RNA polymerase specialized sigma24 family protein